MPPVPLRIALNAVNMWTAGGLTVGLNLFASLAEVPLANVSFTAFVPAGVGYEDHARDHLEIVPVPGWLRRPYMRAYLDAVWLPNRIFRRGCHGVFTLGNLALPIDLAQAVLVVWPYAMYPDAPEVWTRMGLRDRLWRMLRLRAFRHRLRHADLLFVQTEIAAERIRRFHPGFQGRILVVPPAPNRIREESGRPGPRFEKVPGRIDLLCLTRYYSHKNLEILPRVAVRIRDRGLPYRILLTLQARQHPWARALLERIDREGLGDWLHNIGPIEIGEVPAVYGRVEGLLLPTLLESYSATYADAMSLGKPVLTSDRDFARGICGDAASYFDPHDPDAIIRSIRETFEDVDRREELVRRGRERMALAPDWPAVTRTYIDAMLNLTRSSRSGRGG